MPYRFQKGVRGQRKYQAETWRTDDTNEVSPNEELNLHWISELY